MAIHKLIVLETIRGLGKPGLAGGLLLLASLAYALLALLPAQRELVRLQQQAARAEAALADLRNGRISPAESEEKRRDAFYRALPAQADVAQRIERIYAAAAAEQLSLAHGEYAQADIADTRLSRYRITLPVRGGYLRIRQFIAAALAAVPGLGLDDISLQRQSADEAEVEARIQFSLYLVKPR